MEYSVVYLITLTANAVLAAHGKYILVTVDLSNTRFYKQDASHIFFMQVNKGTGRERHKYLVATANCPQLPPAPRLMFTNSK
jgi:hypothetical protein